MTRLRDTNGPMLTTEELDELASIARRMVESVLTGRSWWPDEDALSAELLAPAAAFVSIHRRGELLGCVGTMGANEPLAVAVARAARSAATADPRFPGGILAGPHDELDIEVSVLSALEPFEAASIDDLTRVLRPGVDGLLIAAWGRSATFLPAVWAHVADPVEFIDALWRKAGLPHRSWPPGLRLWRYTTQAAAVLVEP